MTTPPSSWPWNGRVVDGAGRHLADIDPDGVMTDAEARACAIALLHGQAAIDALWRLTTAIEASPASQGGDVGIAWVAAAQLLDRITDAATTAPTA